MSLLRASIRCLAALFATLLACLGLSLAQAAGSPPGMAQARPVDPDYRKAEQAIEAKDWNAAVSLLESAATREPDNADIHNYLGYAERKRGNLDAAFKHYARALELDPRHRGAHEYIGEAYLEVGDLAKAEEHLAALDRLCFFPCSQYRELKAKVAEYRQQAR